MPTDKVFQITLAIVKPPTVKMPHALEAIKGSIIDNDFKVVRSKRQMLTKSEAEDFYREHHGKRFYKGLVQFMTSNPAEFYVLAKNNAITEWRNLMGPTRTLQAQYTAPDTIRGRFGLSNTQNAVHGSDSPKSAIREILICFPDFDIVKWEDRDNFLFKNGAVKFCPESFIHKMKG